jgi:dihydrofolate reductase
MTQQRRIVAFNRVTIDGYFSTPEGGLDWAVPDTELEGSVAQNDGSAGAMIFGRKTYDMFESFWPNALKQSEGSATAQDPHAEGRQTEGVKKMAVWINKATKLVFSRTRTDFPWEGSRGLGAFDPRKVEAIKQEPGGDVMLFGSGTITSLLTQHRLVDEYQFIVSPLLLGRGKTLINHVPEQTKLTLVEAKPFATGNVMLKYALAK